MENVVVGSANDNSEHNQEMRAAWTQEIANGGSRRLNRRVANAKAEGRTDDQALQQSFVQANTRNIGGVSPITAAISGPGELTFYS
ncbi:hypothetical protein Poly51_63420 [Rubripirellula tenax]|uniref:Uncharacterized protein n=1 Tax=Rubripirellula tenax TaxID=2528015 RepID=A0A5C6E4Y6_9BACT|nr:hypothetical protein [Rubripirellula tenax]TWU43564.1 hypothetical protein Poly51_63420 [Rubripirellula tenax]